VSATGEVVATQGAATRHDVPMDAPLTPMTLPPLGDRPLVSVVIPNKDYGRYLPDLLDGLVSQTYPHWEAIVVDDGSADDSSSVVQAAAERDGRIRLLRHAKPRGQAAAFNDGVGEAAGDVICLVDSDDTMAAGKLDAVVRGFRGAAAAGILIHPLQMFDETGAIGRLPSFTAFEQGWLAPRVTRRGGRWRWVPTSGVALRREVAAAIFPMPVAGLSTSADTFVVMLAPLLSEVVVVDELLGGYRRHGANAFARARLDAARVAGAADNLRRSAGEVNLRIAALGHAEPVLKIEHNLKYRELVFQASLLEGATGRRSLFGELPRLCRAVIGDDLYGVVQKAWACVLYGVAIALPVSRRAAWLSRSLSGSRVKELARKLAGSKGVKTSS